MVDFPAQHAKAIVACDFFVAVTATFRLFYVLVLIEHGSRRLVHFNITQHPTAGLLHYEQNVVYSIFPFHVGTRWYWRDSLSLEAWTRSAPHRDWWTNFLRDSGGTGFWHETYSMRGGMEAICDDVTKPVGFACFSPVSHAKGSIFCARQRLELHGEAPPAPNGLSERDLY